ncbi:hypothetical protein [Pseudoalteromonas xiamenensis]|uniref:Uncharacterized protein n=1 Tax=Pseudoalteromonas xiamenensis TaxID=882626 RepID=A0A975DLS2_9GAMM|nr:hypothetical protein [Pseudoalteromonas xiamenensis]QTH73567.1 hypothetical protein J5O05_18965 [Pseudoalteromonas xiamenensis]
MKLLWWEKTVEYYFIQKYVDLRTFVAPLDGNHEKAGDAIFANASKWVLIEFKRDIDSVKDEEAKFTNFKAAKAELEPFGSHHFLIYGEPKSGNKDIDLVTQEYFSGFKVDIDLALSSGISKDSFIKYINAFVSHKKNSESGAGSFGLVAGVSQDATVTKCMSLLEFAEAVKLEQKLQQKIKQEQEKAKQQVQATRMRM